MIRICRFVDRGEAGAAESRASGGRGRDRARRRAAGRAGARAATAPGRRAGVPHT